MEVIKKSPKVMSVKQQCADRALSTAATSGDGCGSQGLCFLPWLVVLEETVVFLGPRLGRTGEGDFTGLWAPRVQAAVTRRHSPTRSTLPAVLGPRRIGFSRPPHRFLLEGPETPAAPCPRTLQPPSVDVYTSSPSSGEASSPGILIDFIKKNAVCLQTFSFPKYRPDNIFLPLSIAYLLQGFIKNRK